MSEQNRPPLAAVPGEKHAAPETKPIELQTVADVIRSESYNRPRRTIPTGIAHLDRAIAGGFKSRQSSIIAAPTGTGKTGLVGTIMRALAKAGRPVLWICTELDAEEQAARFAAQELRSRGGGGYTPDELLSHALPPERVAQTVDGQPIYLLRVRRRAGDPFVAIMAHASAIADKHGEPPVIAVDYLQKLAVNDPDEVRVSTSDVSEQLLDVAQALDTHVLAISSVARSYYNATARKLRKQADDEDPRDWLACGKESGQLEYDAALVAFLDVGDDADQVGDRPARLIVAKSRQGGEGFYGLRFHGPSGLFVPDEAAADAMRAGQEKTEAADLGKIKTEIRRLLMRRKRPLTTKSQIADLLGGRRQEVFRALEEMFEGEELTQEGKGKPIVFTPPGGDE